MKDSGRVMINNDAQMLFLPRDGKMELRTELGVLSLISLVWVFGFVGAGLVLRCGLIRGILRINDFLRSGIEGGGAVASTRW